MSVLSLSEFADQINEIMPALMREFSRREISELYHGKITFPQLLIMDFLYRQGQATMTAVARCMKVTTAAVTGIVERLVRDGYVQRSYDKQDRRVIRISLTARAESLVKKVTEQKRKVLIDIFGNLSEAERASYLNILERIKEIVTRDGIAG